MKRKQIISGLSPNELKQIISEHNLPAFRNKQILDWVFKKNTLTFDKMYNLPQNLRQDLNEVLSIISLNQEVKFISKLDKTTKYLFRTGDNETIESVFIPTKKRATICLSTQAGCAFGCAFCASGKDGLIRNLTPDEIISQVLLIKKDNPMKPITNIVIMGMGEPLANYNNTLKAIRILNHKDCLEIGARKITISTCGLPQEIIRLAKEGIQVELSISLHAATDELRNKIMPINKKHPLKELIAVAKKYTQMTNRVITFEYILIDNLNSKKSDADQLARLLRNFQCKVNLIQFNPVEGMEFTRINPDELNEFQRVLEGNRINFTLRRSRGEDIQGACGQLRLKQK
ncbi:MAG: 23S rRNA (adenine(2503)-C(2))-methyltransferase RlmN [Candidatus Omnitrophota bacterium]